MWRKPTGEHVEIRPPRAGRELGPESRVGPTTERVQVDEPGSTPSCCGQREASSQHTCACAAAAANHADHPCTYPRLGDIGKSFQRMGFAGLQTDDILGADRRRNPAEFRRGCVPRDEQDTGARPQAGSGHRSGQVDAKQHQWCVHPLWTARRRLDGDVHGDADGGGHPEQLVQKLDIRGQHKRSALGHCFLLRTGPGTSEAVGRHPSEVPDSCLWTTVDPVEKVATSTTWP